MVSITRMAKRRQMTVEEAIADLTPVFRALVKSGCLEPTGEFNEDGEPKYRLTEVGRLVSAALNDPTFLNEHKK